MRSKPALFILAVLATAALALTGCGSSSNSGSSDSGGNNDAAAQTLTKAELVAKGDAICKQMEKDSKALDDAETPAEIADALGETLKIYQAALDDLKGLIPPAELEADYETWLEENAEMKKLFEQFKQIAADNDESAVAELNPKMEAQIKKLDLLAKKIGFQTCTRQD